MRYETIQVETESGIGHIVLNRPTKLNAQNPLMGVELREAFARLAADGEVRVVILSGAGERAFSVGADIGEYSAGAWNANDGGQMWAHFSQMAESYADALAQLPKPTIAAVRGYALGAGLELALCCDVRLAAADAKFGFPEVKLGIFPGMGGTQRLPRLVGPARAKDMIFSGEMVNADQALQMGLVSEVVAPEALLEESRRMAERLKVGAPLAIAAAKSAIDRGADLPLPQALQLERDLFAFICTSEDSREGARAFAEKREPRFKGA